MSNHSDSVVEDGYRALASLPLCEAAIVVDVRQSDDSSLLLAHLKIELDDLADEMRYNEIPHWSYVGQCVEALRLDVIPVYAPVQEATDFLIVSHDGKKQDLQGAEDLLRVLGEQYIDHVRTHRLQVPDPIRLDEDADTAIPASDAITIKRSTVRVFFLADMEDQASLTRAAAFGHLLKRWTEHAHGRRRAYRNERMHVVVVCLNVAPAYHDVLLQTLGQMPDSAVDTVILLQKYTDEDATVSPEAQMSQAELLLYTLILRWPDVLWRQIDDPIKMHPQFMEAAKALPWPTFLIGLSAFEYSARWAVRWLDYGVTDKFLETLTDAQKVDQEQSLIKSNINKWLDTWWERWRALVSDEFTEHIHELQGFAELRSSARSMALSRGKLLDAPHKLDVLRPVISQLYHGKGSMTLDQAIEDSPTAILDQLRWAKERGELAADDQPQLEQFEKDMIASQEMAARFLGRNFQKAWGAVPRAIYQLSAMQARIQQVVHETAQRSLHLEVFQEQFEREAQQASGDLERKLATWQAPLLGKLFPSTVISWLLVIVAGILLLFVFPWQALLAHLCGISLSPLALWGLRALLLLLLLAGEWFYLSSRNRRLRRFCRQVETRLRNTINEHLDQAGAVIAARAALPLLIEADLYAPGEERNPYEKRLAALKELSQQTKKQANYQQDIAAARIPASPARRAKQPDWVYQQPSLNNRRELIAWKSVQDAFLQSSLALQSSADSNLLAEVLLRLLGTETPHAILDNVWQNSPRLAGKMDQDRFQALSTMLVALLLSSHVAPPRLVDVLPLVQQYDVLKIQPSNDRPLTGGEVIDLQETVREDMLEVVRGKRILSTLRFKQKQSMDALVLWARRQRERIPQLQEILASHDLLQRLTLARMQPSRVVDGLRKQGALSGVPDDVSGADSFYLFVGQGAEVPRETFLQSLNLNDHQLRQEPFPDCEKLIYLHIHQVRQLFPASEDEQADAGASERVDNSNDAQSR